MTRTLLVVLLVLLLLVLALPLGLGMAMGACPNGQAATCASALGTCAALVGLLVLVLIGVVGAVTDRAPVEPVLLLAHPLERPPRATSL